MKQLLFLVSILILVITNSACSVGNNTLSTTHSTQVEISSSEEGISPENPIDMQFGNIKDIVVKSVKVTDPRNFFCFGIKDQRYVYCLDTITFSGVNIFDVQESTTTLLQKPIKDTRVIKQAYLSDGWLLWEEDEDRVIYDSSYGKDWSVFARNLNTDELIEIDHEKKLNTGSDSILKYTSPMNLSISGERVVYTVFDTIDGGEICAMIKLFDLNKKTFKIIDYKKDYKGGFYSYPSISGDKIVWSYSDCDLIFRGSESGHVFLYDLNTGKKTQLTQRSDILWPVIYEDHIAVRVKPGGDNDNSYIVLYNIKENKWITLVSPQSPSYKDWRHLEMLLPQIYGGYLTWEDNKDREFIIYSVSHNKFYKLHSDNRYKSFVKCYLLSKAIYWSDMIDDQNKGRIPNNRYITILR